MVALARGAAFIVMAAAMLAAIPAAAAEPITGRVVSVHDGDTITVLTDGRQVKVRLHGIDAPELGQAYGQAAKRRRPPETASEATLLGCRFCGGEPTKRP